VVAPADMPPAWQAGFAALQQRFCAGLSARWAQIVQAEDPALRLHALHQLAGAAGSYGFARLSHLAREAEQSLRDGATPAWQPVGSSLETEIHTLRPAPAADPASDTVR
jgi:HPt (histidine-containing phosphotransfer) domain-containing protein